MKDFSVKLQNCYINIKSKSKGEISGGYPFPELTGSISITPKFPEVEGTVCLTFFEVDDSNYGRDFWSIKAKEEVERFLLDSRKYQNWTLWYYHDVHNWKKKPAGIKLQWTLTMTVVDVTINIYNKKGNRLFCEIIG